MKKPNIGITIGDPAGIGPEIIIKALKHPEVTNLCNPVIIGNIDILKKYADNLESLKAEFIDVNTVETNSIKIGQISKEAGKASYDYILKAIELHKSGKLDAIVTAPITKASLKLAEVPHIDHTEIFQANYSGKAVTLLATPELKVAHVMRHLSLKDSVLNLTKEIIVETVVDTFKAVKTTYPKSQRRFIVTGLNPHNSDDGLMGDEEKKIIEPAVNEAKNLGIDVIGPIPADSAFPKALEGEADFVIALLHDQGHIAVKTNNWKKSHGITIGLDVIRTSVDHGSALDIAGKGVAHDDSLLASITAAISIFHSRD